MNDMYFVDLDGTIIDTNPSIWIIDKNNPSKPLKKLSTREFSLIRNGIYKDDKIKIEYNDKSYFISKEIMDSIEKSHRIKNPDRIGISFIELYSTDYINNQKYKLLEHNLKNLVGKDIIIITGRHDRKKHAEFLNRIRLELKKKFDIRIEKIYFVSDKTHSEHSSEISEKKINILLEHLLGFKINDKNEITSEVQDRYDTIYYYDDELQNIEYALNVQNRLDGMMLKSPNDIFKLITDIIRDDKPKLIVNKVTNNKENLYSTKVIKLKLSARYPIYFDEYMIKKFENFSR